MTTTYTVNYKEYGIVLNQEEVVAIQKDGVAVGPKEALGVIAELLEDGLYGIIGLLDRSQDTSKFSIGIQKYLQSNEAWGKSLAGRVQSNIGIIQEESHKKGDDVVTVISVDGKLRAIISKHKGILEYAVPLEGERSEEIVRDILMQMDDESDNISDAAYFNAMRHFAEGHGNMFLSVLGMEGVLPEYMDFNEGTVYSLQERLEIELSGCGHLIEEYELKQA